MANRKHSIIDDLSPQLRETVQEMLLTGSTYGDIVEYLRQNDVPLSMASVCRYAHGYQASVQQLSIAQENFKRMMQELERYPDLDTTEAILRISSQHIMQALTNTTEQEWANIDKDVLLTQGLGLVRAAAYKKRSDVAVKTATDAGIDAVKNMIYETMATERPDLYKQVAEFLAGKKSGEPPAADRRRKKQ